MQDAHAPSQTYDVAIIGAGVVGCALFRELVLAGKRALLVERDADIIAGASKANSAILHTGFDAPSDSIELRCVKSGYTRYIDVKDRLGLPILQTQAIVVAWSEGDVDALPKIVDKAHKNGVNDVRQIGADEVRRCEPNLSRDALGGVVVPGEAVIDPWSAPLAYALQGLANGGSVERDCEVLAGRRKDGNWRLTTTKGEISARIVINCAGNYGDIVEAIARPSPFEIKPRKGQFVVLDKTSTRLLKAILLPVPNDRTKGVVVSRTVFGNLIVGPTAEEQSGRSAATVEEETLRALLRAGTRMVPALATEPVTAAYAGLRPATQLADYQIEALPKDGWITVGGIRSTGLTAALGIAAYVLELYAEHFGITAPLIDPVWPRVPNLAEDRPRPWQRPGRSDIVCHCEMVTEGEIEAALDGPMPAGNLGGLKRRTRCMMGRCQGFYCMRRVMEIASAKLPGLVVPIEVVS